MTSLPRSVRTSSIHFAVFRNDWRPKTIIEVVEIMKCKKKKTIKGIYVFCTDKRSKANSCHQFESQSNVCQTQTQTQTIEKKGTKRSQKGKRKNILATSKTMTATEESLI